jgi:diguanylate cyclase (GGDEF)-like protein/PAS domain S-box-containing protein/putative nucleotidyltransferase with HDIG domain
MNDKKRNISIKNIIIIVFIIFLFLSISIYGTLVYTNWISSARKTTERIAKDINDDLFNKLSSFMYEPYHINEVNYLTITNGLIDISDETLRDKFFVGVLNSHNDEIYSFSYGTVNGEYYGARRNENGIIEIMKNNESTGGNSWYYTANEDMTAGELVVRAGQFNPRTREWYKAAIEAEGPSFSHIYKHFFMDDLTVSAAWPVYNDRKEIQGVLGTHLLLSDINIFLKDAVKEYNGVALIIEKSSSDLIANSMGMDNFTVLKDGTLKRYNLTDVINFDIQNAYVQYQENNARQFVYEGERENFYINAQEVNMSGIDWVVISAIPESILLTDVDSSMRWAAFIATLSLLLSILAYNIVTGKMLKPMNSLLHVAEALSSGDLSKRVEVVRYDEIGLISESFNNVAGKMQSFIENLETKVRERTDELQLLLDSAGEAIYGIDLNGNCTFCNISCIKMLGYNCQEDLLGKNMHWQIHHTKREGTPFPIDECKIFRSIKEGKGFDADDEVFWKADGTSFDVEYHSYPQIKNSDVIGAVITFMDITERKQKEAEIQYLSCHDSLTGLFNRMCFEDNQRKIDNIDNLPISVIVGDINGLKMTNDIFGHDAGDELIKKSAEIILRYCREGDIVARVGGDEFFILLPKAKEEDAKKILKRIKSEFTKANLAAIKCSISLGCDTKTNVNQSLEEIMSNAENAMYKDKTMNRKSTNKDIIENIVGTLHSKSPKEKQHSIIVDELCEKIGKALKFSESDVAKLKRAGYLHDIGKIILDDSILLKDTLTDEEYIKMRQHSVVGYRILNLFDETLDLAEYVYNHHERWDGKGYPRGLKEEEIPLISRIISIAETYERVLNKNDLSQEGRKKKAIEVIKEGSRTQFDPYIVEVFVQIINDNIE